MAETENSETTTDGRDGHQSPNSSMQNVAAPVIEGFMSDTVKVVVIILYGVVVVIGFGGNVTVCYIVAANRRMRTVTNYFIVSLALSDVLMATLCIPMTFVANVLFQYWPFGHAMCPIVLYSQVVAVFLGAFTMLAISIDRYRAVIFPLKPRLTTSQAFGIIAVTWALALVVSLPVAMFARVTTALTGLVTRDFCYETWPGGTSQRYVYSMTVMALQYFLPLAILSFTYLNIGVVVWAKQAPGEAENSRDVRLAASKRKMIKMMITVVIIYALCWLPIHTINLIGDANPDIWSFRHIQTIWIACHWLAMSNSCYNPIVYCWMSDKFRSGFQHAFRCCPCIRRLPTANQTIVRTTYAATRRTDMTMIRTPVDCAAGNTSKERSTMPVVVRYAPVVVGSRPERCDSSEEQCSLKRRWKELPDEQLLTRPTARANDEAQKCARSDVEEYSMNVLG